MSHAPIDLKTGEDDPAGVATRAPDDFRRTVDGRLAAIEGKADTTALVTRLDAIEARVNRPHAAPKASDEPNLEAKAFRFYLRSGTAMPAEEAKALTISSDPQGGYLVPAEMVAEVIRDQRDLSPIRQVASIRSTNADSVIYPRRPDEATAHWIGETETRQETDISFGQIEIPVREAAGFIDISKRLLDDAPQVETEVRTAISEVRVKIESVAFVNGTDSKAPAGFAKHAGTKNGHVSNLNTDKLIEMLYSVPAVYRGRGSWAMNSTTLAAVRKLKNGVTGDYVWQPALVAGQPETILGRPVIEMLDLPDIASGSAPIWYADFSGYRIVDRLGLSVLVDPLTRAVNGLTSIHFSWRVGGAVLRPTLFRKLTMEV